MGRNMNNSVVGKRSRGTKGKRKNGDVCSVRLGNLQVEMQDVVGDCEKYGVKSVKIRRREEYTTSYCEIEKSGTTRETLTGSYWEVPHALADFAVKRWMKVEITE